MPRITHSREIEKMAAKELAQMLYEDEKKKKKRVEEAVKRREIRRLIDDLNKNGWIRCPYQEYGDGLVHIDTSDAELKVIKGSLFWIGTCPNGRKVYLNIYLEKFTEPDLSVVWMARGKIMSEEDFQRWLNGEPSGTSQEERKDENINLRDVNV